MEIPIKPKWNLFSLRDQSETKKVFKGLAD
jgi:hypothetical protein